MLSPGSMGVSQGACVTTSDPSAPTPASRFNVPTCSISPVNITCSLHVSRERLTLSLMRLSHEHNIVSHALLQTRTACAVRRRSRHPSPPTTGTPARPDEKAAPRTRVPHRTTRITQHALGQLVRPPRRARAASPVYRGGGATRAARRPASSQAGSGRSLPHVGNVRAGRAGQARVVATIVNSARRSVSTRERYGSVPRVSTITR